MRFEWDENKNDSNVKRHGIDFQDPKNIFDGHTLTIEDDRFDYVNSALFHSVSCMAM